ncbi:hypothetical protein D3248_06310 [Leucobacter zeae]|nr:hypothetical protein [Leucobacter zeae]
MDGEVEAPRSRGWIWWVTGLLVVAVLGGAGTVIGLDARTHNPADVRAIAEDYVDAISSGDAERANGIAVIDPATETDEILDSGALAEAERISGAVVDRFRVDFDRGRAFGRVSFELEGASYTDRIELERGSSGNWRVTSGLRYQLPYDFGASGAVAFAGMDEAISDASTATAYAGAYRVVSLNPLYEPEGSGPLRMTPDTYLDDRAARVRPSERFDAAVGEELADHYAGCAASRSADALFDCGIDIGGAVDDLSGDLKFSIDVVRMPEFEVEPAEPGWGTVTGEGEFAISVTGRDARGRTVERETTGRATSADLEISVSGTEVSLDLLPY